MLLEHDTPVVSIVRVSPNEARAILENNPNNRNLSKTKVSQYANDMKAGRWAFNGESIVIASDGSLNDGQHRLAAVIQSGVAIDVVVTRGVSRESRFTVDQGLARSAGALLGLNGIKYSNQVAKVARLAIAYDLNGGKRFGAGYLVSTAAILERYAAESEALTNAVAFAAVVPPEASPANMSQLAFWRYLAKDDEKKIGFLTSVAYGEGITRADPAFLVRTRMAREGRRDDVRTEVYLRGLRAFLDGTSFSHIRLVGEFPQV